MPERKVALIGVGNILLGDDGVGVHVVEYLRKKGKGKDVLLVDAGTAFFDVIYDLDGYDKVIIVDAVCGGEEPGAIYKIDPCSLITNIGKKNQGLSLHDYGIIEGLSFGKLAGINIGEVVIIGIEPEKIETFTGLSDTLSRKLESIVGVILEEIGS